VSIVFVFMGFEPAIELNNNNNIGIYGDNDTVTVIRLHYHYLHRWYFYKEVTETVLAILF